MVFEENQSTGNGNGNKMNVRIQNLEGLLSSIAGDGTTAKANCLRQVIRRNKADMAEDASRSLDLMRRIFQPQINDEFRQVIDRHLRTTFSPAIENLRRNGHAVAEEDLNELARGMLEAAKESFTPIHHQAIPHNINEPRFPGYESDDSDISAVSHGSREHKRRRGRPRKEDELLFSDAQPVTPSDLHKWNPERLSSQQRFIYAAKLAANLNIPVAILFNRFPKMFRYVCDDEDKTHLFEERLLSKLAGKVVLVLMEDAVEIQGSIGDLSQYAFHCPESILRRMRVKASKTSEQLRFRTGLGALRPTAHARHSFSVDPADLHHVAHMPRNETSDGIGEECELRVSGSCMRNGNHQSSAVTMTTFSSASAATDERTRLVKGEPREQWTSKLDFLMSVVGFAVDLGNIWRFPYLCFKNGGGVFLIPYTIIVLVTGVPLFYMELALGQYYRKGAITTWGRICPLFKGIGYCVIMIAFYTDFFYNVVIAWGFHYLYTSFQTNLPWASCNNSYNSKACYEPHYGALYSSSDSCLPEDQGTTTKISAAEEYFYKGFLGLHQSGAANSHVIRSPSEYGDLNWHIFVSLFVVYIICYFSLWKGIGMSGKVVWFTALFPYVVLGVLFVRGITLPGARKGIEFYLKPNIEKLKDPNVWQDAATQVFFSLGPGFGVLMAYSSYNKFNNNVYFDALVTSAINCCTSFLSGFVIFSVLGYMSCTSGKSIDKVAQEGPGLVFVVYPEALATMPWAPGWSVLFFLMLITLGLDSSFGGTEAIITALSDEFLWIKRHREIFIVLLFGFYMLIGYFICTQGGILIMEWLIVYGTTWGLLIAVFCEAVVVSYFYGINQFVMDLKEMLGFPPGLYWKICWAFGAPLFLFLMIFSSFWNYMPLVYQDYQFSTTANVLGIFFGLSAAAAIPIVAIFKCCTAKGRTLGEKCSYVFRPFRKRPTQTEYTPIGRVASQNDVML
ncbi:unnamed protein product, partial [Mesorhabditis belari]|uniref:Transporter n=1 Tax=Mesorhabditis belari TaxID=2138241 RepID=A0AAF3E8E3_9BILA